MRPASRSGQATRPIIGLRLALSLSCRDSTAKLVESGIQGLIELGGRPDRRVKGRRFRLGSNLKDSLNIDGLRRPRPDLTVPRYQHRRAFRGVLVEHGDRMVLRYR